MQVIAASRRSGVLVRLSLSVPQTEEPNVRAHARSLANWIEEVAEGSTLLVVDERPGTSAQHLYGVCWLPSRTLIGELRERWGGLTGSLLGPQRATTSPIGAWHAYATSGNDDGLRGHLARVLSYGFKPLPSRRARTCDDVVTSGAFSAVWQSIADRVLGAVTASTHSSGSVTPRACIICSASLDSKRPTATTCTDKCRQRARRARAAAPSVTHSTHGSSTVTTAPSCIACATPLSADDIDDGATSCLLCSRKAGRS